MSFLHDLQTGGFGASLAFPQGHRVTRDDHGAELVDAEHATAWFAFFFPSLHLDLSNDAVLRRDVERHTRFLFESVFHSREHATKAPPRTNDLNWSALVSMELVALEGGKGLSVIHRMAYEPMFEILMGHVLVPLEKGLLELRHIEHSQMTGYRETFLLERLLADGSLTPEEAMRRLRSDDVAYDELFPEHPLSRARAADRWVREHMRVARPAPARPAIVSALGCTFNPPPRFVAEDSATEGPFGRSLFGLHRVSFSGTDGVDRLYVDRVAKPDLVTLGEAFYRAAEVQDVVSTRRNETVFVEGRGHLSTLRMGLRRADEWVMMMTTTTAQSRETIEQELADAVASVRRS